MKQKGCCLFVLAKWFLIACGLLFILALLTANSGDKPAQDAPKSVTAAPATQAPTQAPTPDPTATPEPTPEKPDAPGIDGSQAYDVILSLEKLGITKPETKTTSDGLFEWSSNMAMIDGAVVSYEIHANKNHEILDATFIMSGKNNGFLNFAASLPFDAADKIEADKFISDHITGEPAAMTLGDAVFEIYPNDAGAMLQISDIDSEEFYSMILDKKLGL